MIICKSNYKNDIACRHKGACCRDCINGCSNKCTYTDFYCKDQATTDKDGNEIPSFCTIHLDSMETKRLLSDFDVKCNFCTHKHEDNCFGCPTTSIKQKIVAAEKEMNIMEKVICKRCSAEVALNEVTYDNDGVQNNCFKCNGHFKGNKQLANNWWRIDELCDVQLTWSDGKAYALREATYERDSIEEAVAIIQETEKHTGRFDYYRIVGVFQTEGEENEY